MLYDNNNDLTKLPLAIQARILKPSLKISGLDDAPEEVLVIEMMVSLDPASSTKFAFKP